MTLQGRRELVWAWAVIAVAVVALVLLLTSGNEAGRRDTEDLADCVLAAATEADREACY